MKNPILVALPIVLLLAITAGSVYFGLSQQREAQRLAGEVATLRADLESVHDVVQRHNADQRESTENEEPARDETARLMEQLAEAQTKIATLQAEATSGDLVKVGEETSPDDAADPGKPSLDEMRAKMRENAGVGAQMQAITEMVYADYFANNKLDADTKAAMRQLIIDSQMEQVALAQYAMQLGDVPFREHAQWEDAEKERLAAQLHDVLSADEYAAWESYQTNNDARMLEATFENQLNAFSGGLTPENHAIVRDVAVEEFVAEQNALRNSDTPYTMEENIYYQLRGMDAMRDRLQPVMEPAQFAELENWLTMGDRVLRQQLPQDAQGTP